jgi:molybdenum cofactor guanylyltransferase
MNGLIVAGGNSTRMQQDKALLVYDTLPQYIVVQQLLAPFCKEIFISLQQRNTNIDILQLIDQHPNIGPINALASAYQQAKTNWLIIAIDYPLLQNIDVQHVINTFSITQKSCVYYNMATNFYEPFIGIYTVSFLQKIQTEIESGKYGMQKILSIHNIEKVFANINSHITSVDTPSQFQEIKNKK